jgi:DNA invertase Pin-like site-specific DNA recombinase
VLIENFDNSEVIAEFFVALIIYEDKVQEYDKFWYIWKIFEQIIVEICKNGEGYSTNKIMKAYLLIQSPYGRIWKENAKDWHTLKEKDKRFFKRMSEKIGHCPTTLYSISELLTTIGSPYLDKGIGWISYMIKNNKNLYIDDLAPDTVFNIENLTRKYILKNNQIIKKEKIKKQEVLEILNFLVEKGSSIGYMLRERVL